MKIVKGVLIGLGLLFLIGCRAVPDETPVPASTHPKTSAKEDAIQHQVKFTASAWRAGGFGTVLMLDFSVANQGGVDVKDIQITCSMIGGSGTTIARTTKTVYTIFKANSSQEFLNFNMGFLRSQTENVRCEITDLVLL